MPIDPRVYSDVYTQQMKLPGEMAYQAQATRASQQEQQRAQEMQPYNIRGKQAETQAAELKAHSDKLDKMLQILGSVQSPADIPMAKQMAMSLGADLSQFNGMSDEQLFAMKDTLAQMTLSEKDKLGKFTAMNVTGKNPTTGETELQAMSFNNRTGAFGIPQGLPAGTSIAAKQAADPAAMREFGMYQSMPPDVQQQYAAFQASKRPPQFIDLGGTRAMVNPSGDIIKSLTKTAPPVRDPFENVSPEDEPIIVQGLADGTIQWPTGARAFSNPVTMRLMVEAKKLNPDSGGNQFKSLGAWDRGPLGVQLRAMNTAVNHLDLADKLVDALDNGDLKKINQFSQAWSEETGGTAPTNFDAAKAVVGDEIAKAIIGGQNAERDREGFQASLSRAKSIPQLRGVIKTFKQLLAGQLEGMGRQYEIGTGRKDFKERLSPQAQTELLNLNSSAPLSAGGPETTVPVGTTQAMPNYKTKYGLE